MPDDGGQLAEKDGQLADKDGQWIPDNSRVGRGWEIKTNAWYYSEETKHVLVETI